MFRLCIWSETGGNTVYMEKTEELQVSGEHTAQMKDSIAATPSGFCTQAWYSPAWSMHSDCTSWVPCFFHHHLLVLYLFSEQENEIQKIKGASVCNGSCLSAKAFATACLETQPKTPQFWSSPVPKSCRETQRCWFLARSSLWKASLWERRECIYIAITHGQLQNKWKLNSPLGNKFTFLEIDSLGVYTYLWERRTKSRKKSQVKLRNCSFGVLNNRHYNWLTMKFSLFYL